jgi:hypothetical protein
MRGKHLALMAIYGIGLAVLLPFNFVPAASAFEESDLLTRHIKATNIKGESITQVIGRLPAEYGIPVGIELGDEKLTPDRKIDLDLPETNLKDFLDAVVAKDSRYTWKLKGGVIHLWPLTGRDTLVAALLDTRISHFAFNGEVSLYRIHNELMNLPEIGSQLVVADVAPLTLINSGNMQKLKKGTFFAESNLTLRELLDRIILKTESKRWVITRWGKHSEYITLRP